VCAELWAMGGDGPDLAEALDAAPRWCTMRHAASSYGWRKWPKLHELAEAAGIPVDPAALHDATTDVALCTEIFLRQLSGATIPEPGILHASVQHGGRRAWVYDTPINRRARAAGA